MIGDLTQRQILALSSEGAPPDEIAAALEIEEAAVRLVLSAHNSAPIANSSDRDINDEQLAILRAKAYELATSAEDEGISLRATMFLIERDKPRLSVQSTNPIIQINQAISAGSGRFEELSKLYSDSHETPARPQTPA